MDVEQLLLLWEKNITVWKLNAHENILAKSYEVSKQFKMLCKQELCDLYRSPGTVRMVKI